MTDDNYINKNVTQTFKKGDKVVMHNCGEAEFPKYKGKEWICQTNSFMSQGKTDVVFLEGFSGSFICKYLKLVL